MDPIRHLYIHIPFCAKICPYCSFYVHGGGMTFQERFIQALCLDLKRQADIYPLALETLYIGGGTPSMITPRLFEILAETLSEIPKKEGLEMTLEVNPATVTEHKMQVWKSAGMNRISLGAQSFQDASLKTLGRQHTGADIPETIQQLRDFGFSNINVDLIFGLPWESNELWMDTLTKAVQCKPDHLSAYGLTYEEDTSFFKRLQAGEWQRNQEEEIQHFIMTEETLEASGLPRYEISNFARPGYESRHNLAYWHGKSYLGVGPSAVGTIGDKRITTSPDTKSYIDKILQGASAEASVEVITPEILQREKILLGLRLREGVLEADVTDRSPLEWMIQEGLLLRKGDRLVLTVKGRLVADTIAEKLVGF